jgi:DNA-binding IclR family transcriptional regulator
VYTRVDLVAALFGTEQFTVRELARRLHTSADEVNGLCVEFRALGIVQRVHDADGGRSQ